MTFTSVNCAANKRKEAVGGEAGQVESCSFYISCISAEIMPMEPLRNKIRMRSNITVNQKKISRELFVDRRMLYREISVVSS